MGAMKTLTFFVYILPFLAGYAQTIAIDSLKAVISNSTDSTKVKALNALAFEVVFADPAEAQKLATEAIDESMRINYQRGLLGGHRVLGISYDLRSDYIKAIDAYKKAVPIAEDLNDAALKASMDNLLGVAYYHLSQYNTALEYLLRSLKVSEELDHPRYLANVHVNIGLVYHDQNDLDKALDYYEKAIVYAERINDARTLGRVTNNMGIVLNTKKLYEGAKLYYEQSLNYKQKVNDEIGVAATLQNLAVVYKNLGNVDKAIELLDMAEPIKNRTGDLLGLIQVYDTRIGILIAKRNFKQAEELLEKSRGIIEKIESKEPLINLYHGYKKLYFEMGRFDESEIWQIKKDSIQELLINEKRSNQLATLQSLYELDKKETEIKLLQNEMDKRALQRDIMLISFAGGAIVVVILGIWFYQRHRQQKAYYISQKKLHEAEIQNAELREGELKKELEFKNRELTSYTINFVQKGQLIEDLKENINSIMDSAQSDIATQLTPLKKMVDSNYQIDREWNDFKVRFEEVHTGFFEQLKAEFPELSTSDLRLCSLVKLNMTMKESAKILGISADSVKTSRYRLRKKLNLDRDEGLTDFIMGFGKTKVLPAAT